MLAFFGGQLGWMEILIILGLGVVLFGRRLPEVGRYLGKGIVEFKKGLKGVEDEISMVDEHIPAAPVAKPQTTLPPQTTVVVQYDPYTGKPVTPQSTEQTATHG